MEGMRLYLSHAYGNAVTNDLWKLWKRASGFQFGKLKPWTLEVGYPILLLSDDGSATRFFS
jgi:aminopeptidase N